MTHPTVRALSSLEDLLARSKQRFHHLSDWWRVEVTRFYETGRRQSVWRVGRRGGKSSTICRLVCVEAYYGDHEWPDDDEGVVMIISADQKQAKQRLRTCAVLLREMKIQHDQTADELRFKNYRGQNVVIRVHSASIASVVGCTCICAVLDEVARWGENDRTGNPSEAILESLIPTMATQPNAKIFMISSPMGDEDLHAKAYAEGETKFQTVHFAPTWIANPTLPEEMCRQLARTEREFLREYAAIPQSMYEEGFYDASDLAAASDPSRAPVGVSFLDGSALLNEAKARIGACPGPRVYYMGVDPAFRRDAFGIAVAHIEIVAGRACIVLDYVDELRGKAGAPLSPDAAVTIVTGLRHIWPGPTTVLGDQASADVLQAMFAAKGVVYVPEPWTSANLVEKHDRVRTLLRDKRLFLPKYGPLQRQMANLGLKHTPTGGDSIVSRDGHMGDACSAAVLAICEAFSWSGILREDGSNGVATLRGPFEPNPSVTISGSPVVRQGDTEGDRKYTESETCAECGAKRGECPHTKQPSDPGGHRDYWGNPIRRGS